MRPKTNLERKFLFSLDNIPLSVRKLHFLGKSLGAAAMTTYTIIANSFPGFNQVGAISQEPYLDIRFDSLALAIAHAKANGFCFPDNQQCWHVIGYDENNQQWIVLDQVDMEVIDNDDWIPEE